MAMQPIVRGVSIVSEVRGHVSPHVSVLEGELPGVGVDYAYMGPEGSDVTIFVCKSKRTGCLAATQVPKKGHACPCSGLVSRMAARFGMETIVVEVRQRAGVASVSPWCSPRVWKVLK